jgi:hypothetical protein
VSQSEARLQQLGIVLPPMARAVGNYLPFTRSGNLVFCVQGPLWGDELRFQGRLGENLTLEQGQEAARLVALTSLFSLGSPVAVTLIGCADASGSVVS